MNIDVKALRFEMDEDTRAYLDKKLEKVSFAKDHIVDLLLTFSRQKDFKGEATINFRWGVHAHLVEEGFEIDSVIDKLVDMIEHKISKEKEKIQAK